MLGDGRLAEGKRPHELGHVRIARCEAREDGASRGIGERRKGQAQRVHVFINRHTDILPYSDIIVKPLSSSRPSRFRSETLAPPRGQRCACDADCQGSAMKFGGSQPSDPRNIMVANPVTSEN